MNQPEAATSETATTPLKPKQPIHFDQLRLVGFKSFVEETELPIASGLTGIVGPNGCGKSNLVEAMKWVMGETSAKQMRGQEMDDVIFAGSRKRGGRNIAEVALVLDNRARSAPASLNTDDRLEVVRRIYRGEGSNYTVNGREVRARDVQLLFADASVGAHSPAMVSQGKVAALISAKPIDRRALLEDAAGIGGLNARRHEAELRLKAAEDNLARLQERLQQLEYNHASLQKQARAALKYKTLAERLRQAELALWQHRWQETQDKLATIQHAITTQETTHNDAAATALSIQTQRSILSATLGDLEANAAKTSAALADLKLRHAALAAEERRALDQRHRLQEQRQQLQHAHERETAQRDTASATQTNLLAEQEKSLTDQRLLAETTPIKTTKLAAEQAALEQAETLLQQTQAQLAKLEAEAASRAAIAVSIRERREAAENRCRTLFTQHQALESELTKLGDGASINDKLTALQAALVASEAALAAAETKRAAAEAALPALYTQAQQAEAALHRLDAEIHGLEKLCADNDSGLNRPDPIHQKITIEVGYEAALAAAFGDDLFASTASDQPLRWQQLAALPAPRLPAGVALASVAQAPAALQRALDWVGVVSDTATALANQGALQPGQILVSQAGDLVRWDGLVRLASVQNVKASEHLKQRNRLHALRVERPALQSAATAATTAHKTAAALVAASRDSEQSSRRSVSAQQQEIQQITAQANRWREQHAVLQARRDALKEPMLAAASERDAALQAESTFNASVTDAPELATARSAQQQALATVQRARCLLNETRADLEQHKAASAIVSARLQTIGLELERTKAQHESATAHLITLTAQQLAVDAELSSWLQRPEQLAAERAGLDDALATAAQTDTTARTALHEAQHNINLLAQSLREQEKIQAGAREQLARLAAERDHNQAAIDELQRDAGERFGATPVAVLAEPVAPEWQSYDSATLHSLVAKLTRERDNFGAVNLVAADEAEKIGQEVATATRERDDLNAAISKLRSAISTLNSEGRDRLRQAFMLVNDHFGRIFTRLFGGGTARLELIDSDDPLQSGLEIMASPPGKRLQTLTLLSGGEQALTALALLFSVFLTNPAPICVLDEVDAPLDDANVDRFCTLLQETARDTGTRFLVITHHRMTMARMDRLFGVTMAEAGVSQLVSVDLTAAVALRDAA